MTLGRTPRQADLFRSTVGFCEPRVAPNSIYGLLHRECERLFPDEMFADLFTDVGRRSVPPMIVVLCDLSCWWPSWRTAGPSLGCRLVRAAPGFAQRSSAVAGSASRGAFAS